MSIRAFRRPAFERDALSTDLGRRMHERFTSSGVVAQVFDDSDGRGLARRGGGPPPDLYVRRAPQGPWLRKPDHGNLFVRPNERYVTAINGCRSSCAYCYLRGRGGLRPLTFYVDVEGLWTALAVEFALVPDATVITGEYGDSLADEDVHGLSGELISRIGDLAGNASLELRTKSANVGAILNAPHRGRTIVAFSVSPESQQPLEPGTAPVGDRLAAAAACQRAGYRVALKFEPLILSANWRTELATFVAVVARTVSFERLDHVSVGVLRWSPTLGTKTSFRHALHQQPCGTQESVPYRPKVDNYTIGARQRAEVYDTFRNLMCAHAPTTPLYLSLETSEMVQRFASPAFDGRSTDG